MTRVPLLAALAAAGVLALSPGAATAATGSQIRASVSSGADWLDSQQTPAGSWSGFGGNTVPSALAAAGRNAADISQPGGVNAQDSLSTTLNGGAFTTPSAPSDSASRVGNIERAVLESYSSGLDPQRVGPGQNLAAQLAGYYTGGYFAAQPSPGDADARSTNFAVFGALALDRLDAPSFLVDKTVAAIRANQHSDGGWDYPYVATDADRGAASSTDMTGAAIAALCRSGAGANDPDVRKGVDFLKGVQIQTGGPAGSEGAFAFFGGGDADSTGWAVSGLNACGIDPQGAQFTTDANGLTPIDFLRSLQENGAGANHGTFYYNYGDAFAIGPNVGASQDALRALAGETFSAEPPARTDPTQPRTATPPTVADGTSVPIALAVDDGSGGVSFCRVNVPSGSSLATLLATANGSSSPAGCATGGEFTGGQLSRLNGQTGTWAFSTGGDDQVATNQTVRFGDFVSLRRTSNAVPATPGGGGSTTVSASQQAKTEAASTTAKRLKISLRKRVVSVPVSCAKANRLCQGAVYLVYAKHTLGHRSFLIGGGKTTKLRVRFSKSATKRLGKKTRRVKVNLFSRDGNGVASTSSQTIRLTPTK
jgi:hypothetical protein